MSAGNEVSLYDRVGGFAFFEALVDHFYDGVASDPLLRPMYPDDLTDAKRHLALFLAQYWGGPGTYSDLRGHPRLRMRHLPFAIGPPERDAWVAHMQAALQAMDPDPVSTRELSDYLSAAATHLINQATC